MEYKEILNVLEQNKLLNVNVEIVVDVYYALGCNALDMPDDEFNALCRFVQKVYNECDKGYTQLIADIVVDLYIDQEYGYRDKDKEFEYFDCYNGGATYTFPYILTLDDLKELDYKKVDMVISIFNDRY